jgi:hypothetical protein
MLLLAFELLHLPDKPAGVRPEALIFATAS